MKTLNFFMIVMLLFVFACGSGGSKSGESEENADTVAVEEAGDTTAAKDVFDVISETEVLSTLAQALQAGDLSSTLKGEGPFTIFAPTNEAFNALPEGALDELLLPENKEQLISLLTYHVAAGITESTSLAEGQTIPTVQGGDLSVAIDAESAVTINGVNIIQTDVEASNGIIHHIDAVFSLPNQDEAQ